MSQMFACLRKAEPMFRRIAYTIVGLAAKLKQVGVDFELVNADAPNVRYPLIHEHLIANLKEPKS